MAGLGVGVFLSPNNSAQQGVAGGIRATARDLGNVVGIGLVRAAFNSILARHAPGAGTSALRFSWRITP